MFKELETIEKNIEKLNIDAKAKQTLYQIQTIAGADASYRKQLVPNLLLVSPSGAGTTEYGKVYSRIIDENHIYDIRGLNTFLELDFPYDDSPHEYNLFFSSPRVAASTQNKFYGTFLLSFSRFEGRDLFTNPYFDTLLEFVEQNRDNMHFIFHVLPEFTEKEKLEMSLNRILHMVRVEFDHPDLEMSVDYVWKKLADVDISLPDTYKKKFKAALSEWREQTEFDGYSSLELIAKRIQYELFLVGIGNVDVECFERAISSALPDIKVSEGNSVGFCISGDGR